jgi:hypothetical protein
LRGNNGGGFNRLILPQAAVSQALLNDLVGAAEQKIGFHGAIAFDADGAVRL